MEAIISLISIPITLVISVGLAYYLINKLLLFFEWVDDTTIRGGYDSQHSFINKLTKEANDE